jgi:glycosyltransferase involved in cell wall biosynthesis
MPDTYIGWYPFAVREALRIASAEKIDAIYSTSPPETSHLIASRVHAKTGIPWVADFRDPWMNLYLLPTPTAVHQSLHRKMERGVCSNASTVVTNLWHKHLMLEQHPSIGGVELIRNGYDPSHVDTVLGLSPPDDCFRIVHAGMLTQKRSAVPFLKALKVFIDRTPQARRICRVEFFGPRESENDAAVAELGLDGVVDFKDTVTHDEALKIERTSHILLLIKHTNPVYDGIIPGKLYEYIGVRRPILALAPNGEAGDIVKRLGRGEVVEQSDTNELASRIQMMFARFREGTLDSSYDLSQVDEFRRDVLAGRLAALLDSTVKERN